ncbi:MAG: hypothetical protein WA118_08200 [Carboxydocellales bacterium]
MPEHKISCPRCDGDGEIREDSPIPDTCPRCGGTGKIGMVNAEVNYPPRINMKIQTPEPLELLNNITDQYREKNEIQQVKPRVALRIKLNHFMDRGTSYTVLLEFNGLGVIAPEPGRPFNYTANMGTRQTVKEAVALAAELQRSVFPSMLDGDEGGPLGPSDPAGREAAEQIIKHLEHDLLIQKQTNEALGSMVRDKDKDRIAYRDALKDLVMGVREVAGQTFGQPYEFESVKKAVIRAQELLAGVI